MERLNGGPNMIQLLEIERALSGKDGEEALARYDAVLAKLDERIADAQNEGLTPDDFARVEQLREANVVARKLLRISAREGREQNW